VKKPTKSEKTRRTSKHIELQHKTEASQQQVREKKSSSSSTTVGSMPVGVWRHCYYRCPPLPI